MQVVDDPAVVQRAGAWLVATPDKVWAQVRGFVTDGFAGYARVFHPAMREATEADLPVRAPGESRTGLPVEPQPPDGMLWREVSWSEIAQANGKIAHPAMQWTSITGSSEFRDQGSQPGLWEQHPQLGSLTPRLTRILCETLANFTTTPESCWCAVWEGYGDLVGLRSYPDLPRLAMPGRDMLLAEGPLDAVPTESFSDPGFPPAPLRGAYRSPSFWWPEDRAWCVATDVDLDSTYLGASRECVAAVTADPRIEAMPVRADQSVAWDSDTLNPLPLRPHA